ncbi:MAG: SDR family NAD(P)-dependent oxidoreductase [Calditerrivibrio sp.]|nr:SDR family NAD(P)-dependent oxidoreductase [Calditerrivibrio sp.]
MEYLKSLKNKNVLITGASSGIGEACVKRFAQESANLIFCSRNIEKLSKIDKELKEKYDIKTFYGKVDVRNLSKIQDFLKSIPPELSNIDILINNAGLALGLEKFYEGNYEDWETMIDTNIKGLLYFSKEIANIMLSKNIHGHIINIGSIAGLSAYPNGAVYCATKSAVRVLTDGMRMDLVDKPIKVSNIAPGMTETNFSITRFHGDIDRAKKVYAGIKPLSPEDIAEIVVFTAKLPEHVQIGELTVTPLHQSHSMVIYKNI